jgi:hypothetical protein
MKIYQLEDVQGTQKIPDGDFLLVDRWGYEGKFVDGKLHCEDGPARTWTNGSAEWYIHGVTHRIDGPAVISGQIVWWAVNGFFTSCYEDYQEATGCSDEDIVAFKLRWGKMQYPDGGSREDIYVPIALR